MFSLILKLYYRVAYKTKVGLLIELDMLLVFYTTRLPDRISLDKHSIYENQILTAYLNIHSQSVSKPFYPDSGKLVISKYNSGCTGLRTGILSVNHRIQLSSVGLRNKYLCSYFQYSTTPNIWITKLTITNAKTDVLTFFKFFFVTLKFYL